MNEYRYFPDEIVENQGKLKEAHQEEAWSPPTSLTSSPRSLSKFVVAATQMTAAGLPRSDVAGFLSRATECIEKSVQAGAHLVLLQELFCGPYFCQSQEADLIQLAEPFEGNFLIEYMQKLAKKYQVVVPVSFYERRNNVYYNSVAMIDADGTVATEVYRKSHIPDGTGYQEKFYFSPGDTGFHVFDTRVGKVGVAICWDQWFPEVARCMALQGAEVLLYPTAIGNEPQDPGVNSAEHWQRVMQGHAAANMVPVVASNRYGTEVLMSRDDSSESQRIHFYGKSFITDNMGAMIAECPDNASDSPCHIIVAEVDTEKNRRARAAWGIFRDRRPDLYGPLLTKDGSTGGTPPSFFQSLDRDRRNPGASVSNPSPVQAWVRAWTDSRIRLASVRQHAPRTFDQVSGQEVEICLSYHLKGNCYEQCERKATHRYLSQSERSDMSAFVSSLLTKDGKKSRSSSSLPERRYPGATVSNPNPVQTWLRTWADSGMRFAAVRQHAPRTKDQSNGHEQEICLSYHLKGTCFDKCERKSTHRGLSPTESTAISVFLRQHVQGMASGPLRNEAPGR